MIAIRFVVDGSWSLFCVCRVQSIPRAGLGEGVLMRCPMTVEEVPVVDESDGRRRRAPASTQMLAWVRIRVGSQLLQPLESFPRSHTCSPTARICDGSAMSVWQTDRAFSSRHLCLTGSRRAVKPRCRLSSPRSYPSLRVCRCKGSRWWIWIDVELFRGRSRADGRVKKKAEEEEW